MGAECKYADVLQERLCAVLWVQIEEPHVVKVSMELSIMTSLITHGMLIVLSQSINLVKLPELSSGCQVSELVHS